MNEENFLTKLSEFLEGKKTYLSAALAALPQLLPIVGLSLSNEEGELISSFWDSVITLLALAGVVWSRAKAVRGIKLFNEIRFITVKDETSERNNPSQDNTGPSSDN